MILNRADLIKICNEAIMEGKDICVEITIPGQQDTEFIINLNDSIQNKLDYYCKAYDNNLVHSMNNQIKIVNVKKIDFSNKPNINKQEKNDKEVTCWMCNKKFYINDYTERKYGELGLPYVNCCYCNEEVYLEDENGLKIDETNLEFPKHFFKFGNGVEISDEQTEKWAKEALEYLIKNPDAEFTHLGSGDTVVVGLQYKDEIDIIVGKKYFEFTYDKEE